MMISLRSSTLVNNVQRIWKRWTDDNGSLLAAGVAYYGALSFFPLLLTLISGVGLLLKFTSAGRNAETELLNAVGSQLSPALQVHVAEALDQVRSGAQTTGPIGLVSLLFGAMAIFVQFETAFDIIWNVEPPESRGILSAIWRVIFHRGLAFLMLCGLGVLLLVILILGIALSAATEYSSSILPGSDRLWVVVRLGIPMVLDAAVFALTYRWLPKVHVRWTEAIRGGIFASIIWEIGRYLLTHFLIGTRYSSAYGVVGSFIAVMLWIYYAVTVLFLGAEYIQCVCRNCDRRVEGISPRLEAE
ncbi:MAG: YihY/virulence factor BrkB family protein [Fuerstia sp.]|nr:YihY/virulence factor BrkB family protein [Fuerstiella sp.]